MMTETTPTPTPETTPASSSPAPGPALSDHCASAPPLTRGEKPAGELIKLAEISCYLSRPTTPPSTGTPLLLLLTNAAGHLAPNNQIQADHFASAGYLVLMPDIVANDPAPSTSTLPTELPSDSGILDRLGYVALEGVKAFKIDMWLARHTEEATFPIVQKVLEAAKSELGDKEYTPALGMSVVGYCFGAKYALLLGGGKGEGYGVIAVAVAHPTLATKEDVGGVIKPLKLAAVEDDGLFPNEVREEGIKALSEGDREVEHKVWKGMPHGFAVYGNFQEEEIRHAQQEVEKEFIEFLGRY